MKRFLITIGIGFALLAILFIRIIFIAPDGSDQSDSRHNLHNQKVDLGVNPKKKDVEALPQEKEVHILRTYYDNSEVSSEWPFVDGKLEGSVKQYDSNGKFLAETDYKNNVKDGIARTYYENHRIRSEYYFRDGIERGIAKEYYPNGSVWLEITYQDGRIEGVQLYSESGQADQKTQPDVLISSGGQTSAKAFYLDERVSAEFGLSAGKLHGEVKLFYPDGVMYKKMEFDNGEAMGSWLTFYPGQANAVWSQIEIANGIPAGLLREYYPSGALWIEIFYPESGTRKLPKAYSESGRIFQETRVIIQPN